MAKRIEDIRLDHGSKFPYDRHHIEEGYSETPNDWARFAALGVLADLSDRRGIKHELYEVDDGVRAELVASLTSIIRRARERLAP